LAHDTVAILKAQFLSLAHQNFFRNWSVPAEHEPRLSATFSGWAAAVSQMGASSRADLEGKRYLCHLEPYLRGEASGFEQDEDSIKASADFRKFVLHVVNLSGEELASDFLRTFAPGMTRFDRGAAKGRLPSCGDVNVLDSPIGGKLLSSNDPPALVLILSPPVGTVSRKLLAMKAKSDNLERDYPEVRGRVFRDVKDVEEWKSEVASLAQSLPPPAPPKPPRDVVVVLVLALPPGGGKTTFFQALKENVSTVSVVSSDEQKAKSGGSKGAFDSALRQAIEGGASMVGYDKNVPNEDGLAKAVKVLEGISKEVARVRIKMVCVVPSRLDRECAWARVEARSEGDLALSVHAEGGGKEAAYRVFREVFFEPSLAFLGRAQSVPGAMVSDAFWGDVTGLSALAAEAARTSGAPLEVVRAEIGKGGGVGKGGVWASAELPATRLHLTLVPPPGAAAVAEDDRKKAMGRLEELVNNMVGVELIGYVRASSGTKQLGYWEVRGDVAGMQEEHHLGSQRDVYHVSDLAALVNAAPKECAGLRRALLGAGEGGGGEVEVEVGVEVEVEVDGVRWIVQRPVPVKKEGVSLQAKVSFP
jgi:hypothetical protein